MSSNLDIDAIIFDCDGVLVDITQSYDLAIDETAKYFLQNYSRINNPIPVDSEIITAFKKTGGFNDEVDLTYAAILSQVAAKNSKKDPLQFTLEVAKNADKSGIFSVEKYIDSENIDISNIRTLLSYPGKRHENILYSVFDQLFYGPELYKKIFGKDSEFSKKGLIENDVVILNHNLISLLKKKVDQKICIVSGRGLESIRYSLGELLDEFDISSSAFLEDEPRELAKPNPESLLRAIKKMNSRHCLYVGDSMEDYMMAKEANSHGFMTSFCGIVGTSKDPQQKRNLFSKNGAQLILESIHDIPKALNLV